MAASCGLSDGFGQRVRFPPLSIAEEVGMTTKQIAEAAGCSVETVQRKIRELYPEAVQKGRATVLSEATAVRVMSELRKIGFVQPRQNDEVPAQIADARLDRLEGMVEKLVGAFASMVPNLRGVLESPRTPAALPPPAELEPRAALRKIVEAWARRNGRDFHGAWAELYREYGYRYRRDISRAAKNRGQSVLDYADDEDLLGQLLALAYFLYGHKEAVGA